MITIRFNWRRTAAVALFSLAIVRTPAFAADTAQKLSAVGVSASTYESDGPPAGAIDGKLDTRWAGFGSGAYITLDWGSSKAVKELRMGFYEGDARVYAFEVLYSTDNKTYKSAGSFKSSGKTGSLEKFALTATGRYLRIVGRINTVNRYNSYTEVQGFILVPGAPPPGGQQGGATVLNDTFEGSALDKGWNTSGNKTSKIIGGVSRGGSKSVQLKLGPDDEVPYRTEIVRNDGTGDFRTGNTYCLSFSVMAKNWSAIPQWNTLLQTHAVPYSWDSGYLSGRNSIGLSVEQNGNLSLRVIKDQKTTAATGAATGQLVAGRPVKFGTWHDFLIHFRPSKTTDGIIEVWMDGSKLYSQLYRPNIDLYDEGGQEAQNLVYLKLGIYKDPTDTAKQEVYYDNVKIIKNPTVCTGD